MNATPKETLPRTLLALLLLAGAALRVQLALGHPLWDDELWQRFVTREATYLDFLLWRHDELVHPPLSFFLNRLCCDFFQSDAAWVWRLPSLVAGVLCIPAGFALGKKMGSSTLALGIAAMLAFDLNTTWESANARMYALLALEILAALNLALQLFAARALSWRRAIALGGVLAALLWTHMLGVLPWCALGLTGAFLLLRRETRPRLPNFAIAFGVACLLGLPGLVRLFAVRGGVGAAIPHRSFSEVFHLLHWVTNLLVWIEVRFLSPLILVLSMVGALAMFRRFRALSVLLLSLGLVTAFSQIHLLHTHPFTVMRYFIPAQPILWIGLPFLLLAAPPPRLRTVATAIFGAFIAVQAWNCTRLEATYGTVASDVKESRAFVDAVDFVKASQSAADAVAYWPRDRFAYRGEYFCLPASEAIGGPARPAAPRFPKDEPPPPPLEAPAVWIVARWPQPAATNASTEDFERLMNYYRPGESGPDAFGTPAPCWMVTRIAREGITTRAFPIE